tara:strand:- start:2213 stop:2539 length:327 start_codon:yes stop_codon:yes gene_type:complete
MDGAVHGMAIMFGLHATPKKSAEMVSMHRKSQKYRAPCESFAKRQSHCAFIVRCGGLGRCLTGSCSGRADMVASGMAVVHEMMMMRRAQMNVTSPEQRRRARGRARQS